MLLRKISKGALAVLSLTVLAMSAPVPASAQTPGQDRREDRREVRRGD